MFSSRLILIYIHPGPFLARSNSAGGVRVLFTIRLVVCMYEEIKFLIPLYIVMEQKIRGLKVTLLIRSIVKCAIINLSMR